MNPNPGNGPSDDADQPISQLRDLEIETSPDFAGRVRRMVHRREAASQALSFSWNLPKTVLLEIAGVLSHIVKSVAGVKHN